VDGVNVVPEVYAVKNKIKAFTHEVISGSRTGFTGSVYRCCQYIGGSDLGPAMAVEAFYKNNLNIHFVSNVDGDHVNEIIKTKSRNNTFVIVSRLYNTRNINQF
jgi:glucose-6-phosphate isomerase